MSPGSGNQLGLVLTPSSPPGSQQDSAPQILGQAKYRVGCLEQSLGRSMFGFGSTVTPKGGLSNLVSQFEI